MKTFLRILLFVFHLAALGAAGWYGWLFWERYKALDAERSELVAENAHLRTEADRLRAEAQRVAEAKEALGRNLVAALSSCKVQEERNRRLQDDRAKAESALREELRRQGERLRASDARAEQAERRVRRAAEEEPGVDSLSELVELTDRAPRKAN